jgi:hypothetical protein
MLAATVIPPGAVSYLLGSGALLAAGGILLGLRSAAHHDPRTRWRRAAARAERRPASAARPAGSSAAIAVPAARRIDEPVVAALADELRRHRHLAAARTRLGEDLAMLDSTRWHVERDVSVAGVSVPFVLFGPHGVFALAAGPGWAFTDLPILDRLSRDLAALIAGYPDPVRAGVYLPFEPSRTRAWFDRHGAGGWIIGHGDLNAFLHGFHDRGFSASDIAALRRRIAAAGTPRRTAYLPPHSPRG